MITRQQFAFASILAAYVALGVLYAIRTPLWQVPDEPAHFNYVAQVSDASRDPPEIEAGDYPFAYLEALKAEHFPADKSVAGIEYEDHQPPAYYYLAAVVYRASGAAADDAQRVRAIRLLGVLLGAVTVGLAWRIARLAWPEDPILPLATAAFVSFLPMNLTMTAAVNNDPLADLIAAALLLLAVERCLGRLGRRKFVIGGGLLVGLAFLTKVTIYGPALALPVAAEAMNQWRDRRPNWRRGTKTVLSTLGIGLLIGLPWFARNTATYGWGDPFGLAAHAAVVVGQPRTADWVNLYGAAFVLRRLVGFTFASFWGVFGWMGVFLDRRIYLALALTSAGAIIGVASSVWRLAHQGGTEARRRWCGLAVMGTPIAIVAAAFLVYNWSLVQHQGRYFFPALIPIALLFVLGLRELARVAASAAELAWPAVGQRLRLPLETFALLGFSTGLAALALLSLQRYIVPGLR